MQQPLGTQARLGTRLDSIEVKASSTYINSWARDSGRDFTIHPPKTFFFMALKDHVDSRTISSSENKSKLFCVTILTFAIFKDNDVVILVDIAVAGLSETKTRSNH
jgi:hypothetical protein